MQASRLWVEMTGSVPTQLNSVTWGKLSDDDDLTFTALGAIEVNGKVLKNADVSLVSGEFWSGLDALHALTKNGNARLRIGLGMAGFVSSCGWSTRIEHVAWPGASLGSFNSEAAARAACVDPTQTPGCQGISHKFADGGTGGGSTGTYYTWIASGYDSGLRTFQNWESCK